MPRNAERYLFDIVEACTRIGLYTAGSTFDGYNSTPQMRDAVERCLEIVGEAIRQVLQQHAELSPLFPEAREIVGLRNILAHEYGDVDDERVWLVAVGKIPELLSRAVAELDRREAEKAHK